jgi:tRNA U55 pseudouridine synthase TruB
VAEESIGKILLEPDRVLSGLPFVDLSADEVRKVRHGMNIQAERSEWRDGERVRMRDENSNLIAVAIFNAAQKSLHPSVVLSAEN